ncbi:ABC transporter ATP-binding protein [Aneurinibacillus sp. BA2021]|nr:ABC transporter ATP-binding protein [Aneurinibacillus sp. BA2021]
MEEQTIVDVRGISKTIQGETIIHDLSFSVRRGEIYGLLGPNGSGKTCTIRLMVGLLSLTAGDVLIAGHSIKTERNKALSRIGAIVENPDLYGYMTGRQNLKHFARMYGHTAVDAARMVEIADLVELTDVLDRKVKTYSLGMRQRLGIAQALLHRPDVLILDEPTNGLDPAGIRKLRDYLRRLAKEENIAILLSSHLLAEIEMLCDRVVIIQNGRTIEERNVRNPEASIVRIELEVTEPDRAALLLADHQPVRMRDAILVIEARKQHIPALVALLVAQHIGVFQVKIKETSLEDTFLALTGGTQA